MAWLKNSGLCIVCLNENSLYFIRLRDISEETAAQHQPRKRSNSLPIPKIEVSFYQSTESKKVENKDFIEVPEPKDVSLLAGILVILRNISSL